MWAKANRYPCDGHMAQLGNDRPNPPNLATENPGEFHLAAFLEFVPSLGLGDEADASWPDSRSDEPWNDFGRNDRSQSLANLMGTLIAQKPGAASLQWGVAESGKLVADHSPVTFRGSNPGRDCRKGMCRS